MRFLKGKRCLDDTAVLTLYCFLFCTASCTEPGPLSVTLPSATDGQLNYSVSDTTSVYGRTMREDSLTTDEKVFALAGSYLDPVFGKATAAFVTQFQLSSASVDFGTGFAPDSIVLSLSYQGYYNSSAGSQKITIFELNEDISISGTYYSNSKFLFSPNEIGSRVIAPQTGDTAYHIKMDTTLCNKFPSSFAGDQDFQSLFKGIYCVSDTTTPSSILYFDLLNTNTKLILYYHTDSLSGISYNFVVSSSCARVNLFNHNFSNSIIPSALADTATPQSNLYVQAMSGVKAKITFPFFSKWSEQGHLAVSKAELTVSIAAGSGYSTYPPPSKLFLVILKNDGTEELLSDIVEGESFFGGYYNISSLQYSFNISRYIQEKLTGSLSDEALYLLVPNNNLSSGSASSASRVVINGNTMKLKMVFTVI